MHRNTDAGRGARFLAGLSTRYDKLAIAHRAGIVLIAVTAWRRYLSDTLQGE